MEQLFTDMLERFNSLYQAIETAVADLPDEALNWKPGADLNSIAVIMAHTAGAWRYWVGDVAGDMPSDRDRAEEFETRNVSAAEMLERLHAALETSREVLEQLDPSRLGEIRTSGLHDKQRTVGWAIIHALEHTALHTGHIQITRQLWEQRGQVLSS